MYSVSVYDIKISWQEEVIKEGCLKGILEWEPGTVVRKWLRSSTVEKICKGVDEASEGEKNWARHLKR